jgi:RNA polymerase sigma factor (sigma-70 family)
VRRAHIYNRRQTARRDIWTLRSRFAGSRLVQKGGAIEREKALHHPLRMDDRQRRQLNDAIVRLALGDREAFTMVFDGLWPTLVTFMDRAMPGHHEREDLAQRTLLNVFSRISEFDVTRDGVAWVFGIASYEVKTLRRQLQRRRETADADSAIGELAEDPARSPEEIAIHRDLQTALTEALGALTPAERAVLMGEEEQREHAGVSASAWRKRRQRALDKLRTIWGKRHA